jgi:hypothetical protein
MEMATEKCGGSGLGRDAAGSTLVHDGQGIIIIILVY